MPQDASFHDADEKPVRLLAQSAEDLEVVSSLLQDAVATAGDVAWLKGRRRFALLLGRFRWEDKDRAAAAGRPFERVRAVLSVDQATAVRAAGVDPAEKDAVLSILSLSWDGAEDPEDPSGTLRITLAGDGEIAVEAEYLDLRLEDVTRPYAAPSGKAPTHDA
ncbi:DUF2948 family protein [Rhodovulum sp. DZ06]|uniref:DUF2948 family protein n=1 Tax=Rhodovulum sp. DZ06 TaxID=3425126 RepID=UPI003D326421